MIQKIPDLSSRSIPRIESAAVADNQPGAVEKLPDPKTACITIHSLIATLIA